MIGSEIVCFPLEILEDSERTQSEYEQLKKTLAECYTYRVGKLGEESGAILDIDVERLVNVTKQYASHGTNIAEMIDVETVPVSYGNQI